MGGYGYNYPPLLSPEMQKDPLINELYGNCFRLVVGDEWETLAMESLKKGGVIPKLTLYYDQRCDMARMDSCLLSLKKLADRALSNGVTLKRLYLSNRFFGDRQPYEGQNDESAPHDPISYWKDQLNQVFGPTSPLNPSHFVIQTLEPLDLEDPFRSSCYNFFISKEFLSSLKMICVDDSFCRNTEELIRDCQEKLQGSLNLEQFDFMHFYVDEYAFQTSLVNLKNLEIPISFCKSHGLGESDKMDEYLSFFPSVTQINLSIDRNDINVQTKFFESLANSEKFASIEKLTLVIHGFKNRWMTQLEPIVGSSNIRLLDLYKESNIPLDYDFSSLTNIFASSETLEMVRMDTSAVEGVEIFLYEQEGWKKTKKFKEVYMDIITVPQKVVVISRSPFIKKWLSFPNLLSWFGAYFQFKKKD